MFRFLLRVSSAFVIISILGSGSMFLPSSSPILAAPKPPASASQQTAETFGYQWLDVSDTVASVAEMRVVAISSNNAVDAIAEVMARGDLPATYRELDAFRRLASPLPCAQVVALGSIAHTGADIDILQSIIKHRGTTAIGLITKTLPFGKGTCALVIRRHVADPDEDTGFQGRIS